MIFGSYRQGIKFFSSPLMVTTKDLSCADRLPTTNMNCFFKSYLIYICHSRRLRESMQLLTLALAQMSAVHLLFSDCFLRGALSSILSTTLVGWVGALRFHHPLKDDIVVRAYKLYISCSDHWSHPHSTVDSAHTVATLEAMLDMGARCIFLHFHLLSKNIYMFFSSAFSPTHWAMLIRNIFAFSLAQCEHLYVPWGHLVRLYSWIKLLSFFGWWIPSDSNQVWDLITLSISFCNAAITTILPYQLRLWCPCEWSWRPDREVVGNPGGGRQVRFLDLWGFGDLRVWRRDLTGTPLRI